MAVNKTQSDVLSGLKHFRREEWIHDPAKVAPQLALVTDAIRGLLGVPLILHVCWDDSGHSEQSYHYTGQACDGHFAKGGQSYLDELLAFLSFSEVGGLGFYPEWSPRPGWHWDIRQARPKVFWARQRGKYHYGLQELAEAVVAADSYKERKA